MGVVVNNPAIGIDFGTSNSTVGYSGQGSYSLVRFEGDNPNIPSAIFFDLDDGAVLFGRAAAQRHIDGHRGRFMRSMKSVLGSSLMEERLELVRQSVTFASIIGLFIGHLKRVAETHLGHGDRQGRLRAAGVFRGRGRSGRSRGSGGPGGFGETAGVQGDPVSVRTYCRRAGLRTDLHPRGAGHCRRRWRRHRGLLRHSRIAQWRRAGFSHPGCIGFPRSSYRRHGLRSRLEPAIGDAPAGLSIADCRGLRIPASYATFPITSSSSSLRGTRSIRLQERITPRRRPRS